LHIRIDRITFASLKNNDMDNPIQNGKRISLNQARLDESSYRWLSNMVDWTDNDFITENDEISQEWTDKVRRLNELNKERLKLINEFKDYVDEEALSNEIKELIEVHYYGRLKFGSIRQDDFNYRRYEIYFEEAEDDDLEESFGDDKKLDKKLKAISNKYNVVVRLSSYYISK